MMSDSIICYNFDMPQVNGILGVLLPWWNGQLAKYHSDPRVIENQPNDREFEPKKDFSFRDGRYWFETFVHPAKRGSSKWIHLCYYPDAARYLSLLKKESGEVHAERARYDLKAHSSIRLRKPLFQTSRYNFATGEFEKVVSNEINDAKKAVEVSLEQIAESQVTGIWPPSK